MPYYYNAGVLNPSAVQPKGEGADLSSNNLLERICGTSNKISIVPSDFPAGATVLRSGAFDSNDFVTVSVELPEGIATIQSGAFNGPMALLKVVLPDSVKTLESGAFTKGAETTVVIGGGIDTIQSGNFTGMSKLETLVIKRGDAVPTLQSPTIDTTALKAIYVADSLVDSYKAASMWSNYSSYFKPLSEWEG